MSAAFVLFDLGPGRERLRIFTPLGIRFWDPAVDRPVGDGLRVTARPAGRPGRGRLATLTASGVYAFFGLPGLRDIEYPKDDPLGASPLTVRRFVVEVEDGLGRFLPATFAVDAPYLGIFPTEPGLPTGAPGVFLFSAPTRPILSTAAVVRASLEAISAVDGVTTRRPAAHTVLEVSPPGGPTRVGVADARGEVAVVFPYPSFATAINGGGGGSPLRSPVGSAGRRWPLRLRVRHDPGTLTVHPGSTVPDLRSILEQGAASLRPSRLGTGAFVAEARVDLVFGQELVVRTDGGPTLEIRT
jgi:hypothetical protein